MRKRLIAVFIIFTIALTGVSAYDFILSPWQGGFGLNMASSKYDFSDKDIGYELQSSGMVDDTGARAKYTDAEIIGIVGVHNIDTLNEDYDPKGMTVTARCDGGFYFTSRSNPDAKRPFEIKLVLKRNSHSLIGTNNDFLDEYFTLGQKNKDLSVDNYDYPGVGASWSVIHGRFRNLWCDLVICLPFDSITSTGELTADGRRYNLVEADDYSAVVTIEIEFNGETQSLTIPLSGYYSRNIDPSENMETASLDVRTLPAAMNLNIGGTRRMERVADVDFMVSRTSYSIEEVWGGILSGWETKLVTRQANDLDYHIFLSASNDPNYSEGRGFELVHTSVNYSEPHTPYNSIGYTARLVNDETGGYMDFDGTDAIVGNNVPGLSATKRQVENQKHDIYYSEFHGGIEVLIDEITATGEQEGINKMLSGQYTSTIYVHVVGE